MFKCVDRIQDPSKGSKRDLIRSGRAFAGTSSGFQKHLKYKIGLDPKNKHYTRLFAGFKHAKERWCKLLAYILRLQLLLRCYMSGGSSIIDYGFQFFFINLQ